MGYEYVDYRARRIVAINPSGGGSRPSMGEDDWLYSSGYDAPSDPLLTSSRAMFRGGCRGDVVINVDSGSRLVSRRGRRGMGSDNEAEDTGKESERESERENAMTVATNFTLGSLATSKVAIYARVEKNEHGNASVLGQMLGPCADGVRSALRAAVC